MRTKIIYEVGDWVTILSLPCTWASALCERSPLSSGIQYPLTVQIEEIKDMDGDYVAMRAGGYGFALDGLERDNNIRPAMDYEIKLARDRALIDSIQEGDYVITSQKSMSHDGSMYAGLPLKVGRLVTTESSGGRAIYFENYFGTDVAESGIWLTDVIRKATPEEVAKLNYKAGQYVYVFDELETIEKNHNDDYISDMGKLAGTIQRIRGVDSDKDIYLTGYPYAFSTACVRPLTKEEEDNLKIKVDGYAVDFLPNRVVIGLVSITHADYKLIGERMGWNEGS